MEPCSILFWFFGGADLGSLVGLPPAAADAPPIIGISVFWSPPFIWFYMYFASAVAVFAAFWRLYCPHPWWRWAILVTSALILFITYFQVQVSVAVNDWYGPFYDSYRGDVENRPVDNAEFYSGLSSFAGMPVAVGMACRWSTSSSSATRSSAGAPR